MFSNALENHVFSSVELRMSVAVVGPSTRKLCMPSRCCVVRSARLKMSSSAPDQLPPPKPVGFNASHQRVHRPRAAAPGIVVLAEPVQSAHQQGPAASATIPPWRSVSSNVTDADHRIAATSHEPPISSASSHGKRKRDEHDTTAKTDPGEHGKTVKA